MPDAPSIHEFLREAHIPYTVVPHRAAFTAQEEAAATHIPGRFWAKVVICFVDGQPIQAALPAPSVIDLDQLLELTGGSKIRVARKEELADLFPGCDAGAMPPLGPLYGQTVFADVELAAQPEIIFGAGTYTEAIVMRWRDFAKVVKPIVGRFAQAPLDQVGEHRLSYRE